MNNNTNKENWIDNVLGSTAGMQRAQPSGNVYEGAMARLSRPPVAGKNIPIIRWAVAAVLLIMVNIASVIYFDSQHRSAATGQSNPLAAQIQTETTYSY